MGGPIFAENTRNALLTAETADLMSAQNISALEQLGAHPRQLCRSTDQSAGRIVIDPNSEHKYLHIPLGLSARKTQNVLASAGSAYGGRITLGFPRSDYGYMGRGPSIHNHPNMRVNLNDQETLEDDD